MSATPFCALRCSEIWAHESDLTQGSYCNLQSGQMPMTTLQRTFCVTTLHKQFCIARFRLKIIPFLWVCRISSNKGLVFLSISVCLCHCSIYVCLFVFVLHASIRYRVVLRRSSRWWCVTVVPGLAKPQHDGISGKRE